MTQPKRSVSDGADVEPYGGAAEVLRGAGRTLRTLQYLTDSGVKLRPVADRKRSSELGLARHGVALHCYKTPAKPQGTLTSAGENLGATSQR